MIVTCASCLTKYNLDDSRIPLKGVKVRCSRCKHVFYVVPPPETREEIIEDFESFAKYHEELMGPSPKEEEVSESPEGVKEEEIHEEEEKTLFAEKPPEERVEPIGPILPSEEERPEAKPTYPRRRVRKMGWIPSRFFILIIILILLVLGLFYAWTEMGAGGKLFPLIETPFKKVSALWDQIWGLEKEGLLVGDLNRYDERVGDTSIFVIEGKVKNQSKYIKKHIKVKVLIFDQNRNMVASQEVVCGRSIGREALRNLLLSPSKEEIVIHPQTVKEKEVPPGKAVPFMVVFKNIPEEAKEFKVEIIEAPSL